MIMIAITIVIYKTKAIDMIRITIRNHTNVSIKNSGGMRKQHGNRILNTGNCEKDKGGWIIQKNSQTPLVLLNVDPRSHLGFPISLSSNQ